MSTDILKANNNLDELMKAQQKPVILDFWAPWCGPCQQLTPVLVDLAKKVKGDIAIIKINVDDHQALLPTYEIMHIPTLVFINKKNEVVAKTTGYKTLDQLREQILDSFAIAVEA